MAVPKINLPLLFDAGVHFGHRIHRWNPKMRPYIFCERGGLHIIDLTQTVPLLKRAIDAIRDVTAAHGRILFVGTKRQASGPMADAAQTCSQYCINHRWLGGLLTNWKTVANSIHRLDTLEESLADEDSGLTKKERLNNMRERDKLTRTIGGVRKMGSLPDLLFVIDTNREMIAVKEAWKLGIPVAAVLDTDSNPEHITYPIPGNDDGRRAVQLYAKLAAEAALEGLALAQSGEMAPPEAEMDEKPETPETKNTAETEAAESQLDETTPDETPPDDTPPDDTPPEDTPPDNLGQPAPPEG